MKRALINIGTALTATALSLLAAEIVARYYGLGVKFGRFLPVHDVPTRVVDGNVLWDPPNPRYARADIGRRPKDSDAFTIIGLGDSIMYGVGEAKDGTYLEHTRRMLMARTGRTVETINLAVPGYNTKQEAAVLQEIEGQIRADLIIVHYWGDDVHQYRHVGGYIVDIGDMSQDGRLVVRALPLPDHISDFLLVRSRLYELLTELALQYTTRPELDDWTRVSKPLKSIQERAQRMGGRVLVLASVDMSGPSIMPTSDLATLQEFAQKEGIEVIDLTEWLRGIDPRSIALDSCHFNEDGHRLIGDGLGEYLLARDLKK